MSVSIGAAWAFLFLMNAVRKTQRSDYATFLTELQFMQERHGAPDMWNSSLAELWTQAYYKAMFLICIC